jgi:RsiW-degrading membrane proteinase PrsW (M82 family)
MTIRTQLTLAAMPFIVVGGFLLAYQLPDTLESLYDSFVGPFLFTYWIGLGFTSMWDTIRHQMLEQKFTPGMVAAVGALGALLTLSQLGFDSLWHDPWLFGVAVAPGFAMLHPWLEHNTRRPAAAEPQDAAGD